MSDRPSAATLLRHALAGRELHDGPRLVLAGDGATAPLCHGLLVGRSRGAGLRLRLVEVSRVHAEVVAAPGGWGIVDRSKNGLVLNGAPVRGTAPLRAGDELELGSARLRVVEADEPSRRGGGDPSDAPAGAEGSRGPAGLGRPRRVAAGALVALALALAALAAA